jgi:hypothetical protein
MKRDPATSYATAMRQGLEADPNLYRIYEEERSTSERGRFEAPQEDEG